MEKQRKPLSTKKPPVPTEDYKIIEKWLSNKLMPGIQPLIKEIDTLINKSIPNLQYSIKWGSAFYGTKDLGWLIELAPYAVSANIVFLNGENLDPKPPLGNSESRYFKIKTIDELKDLSINKYIENSSKIKGWQ
jgi:hypothetical protein